MRYLIVLLIAGCATPEQQAYDQRQRQAAYADALTQKCVGYGFKQGEPAMANCRMQLDMAVRQQAAAKKAQNDATTNAMTQGYFRGQQQELDRLNQRGVTCSRNGDSLYCR
jgi:uncharacterized protein HemX